MLSPENPTQLKPDIGLAFSGGGFRAAAFHLGVLKRLEELGLLPRMSILSTVSGGSITGALYALRCAQRGNGYPGSYPVERLVEEMRELITIGLRRQALLGSPWRAIRTGLSFVSRRHSRMTLFVEELDQRVFKGAHLSALPGWILINATNLATGKGWKFFHDCAGDYLIGATDKTDHIRVAEAVGASAAYPLLTDPYPFETRWEDLRADLLDERWARPPQTRSGDVSRWRRRYGELSGTLMLPLADGGLYDNEGLNGLRSARVRHAIYASTATPDDNHVEFRGAKTLLRTVIVMHNRLGAVTRQHAHEMTHGLDPGIAKVRLNEIAEELRALSKSEPGDDKSVEHHQDPVMTQCIEELAGELETLGSVGHPPHGHQYATVTPILLHRIDIARNRPATYSPPYDIPPEQRGLDAALVEELARVRTDLDAYAPVVVDLLIAQGYFLADAHLKVNMPEVLREISGSEEPLTHLQPDWVWAHNVVAQANANHSATVAVLRSAEKRNLIFGHSRSSVEG